LLLEHTDVRIIIAGRSLLKAEDFARDLNQNFPGDRAAAVYVDVDEPQSLGDALKGVDMLIVCSTTSTQAHLIAEYALKAGIDYLDIYYPQKVVQALKPLDDEIKRAGRCFITQAGIHPGMGAPLVRWAATQFDQIETANIAMALSFETIGNRNGVKELLGDLVDFSYSYWDKDHWKKGSYRDTRKFDLGPDWGVKSCIPMGLVELTTLPQQYKLAECGLWGAGFNWFIDMFVFPLAALFQRVDPRFGLNFITGLFMWGMNRFSKPPFGIVLKLEAQGEINNETKHMEVLLEHSDGYLATAIPVAATLLQYIDGSCAQPGLHLMGLLPEPIRFMKDIKKMGLKVHKLPSRGLGS